MEKPIIADWFLVEKQINPFTLTMPVNNYLSVGEKLGRHGI
jgi:hypothetical protein